MADQEAVKAPAPGTPEYDAAMAAKVDEAATKAKEAADPQEIKPEVLTRPDNVPEEFWDAEKGAVKTDALLKALAETKGEPKEEPKEDDKAPEEDPEKAAKEALEAKGVNYADLQKEFDEGGKLTDESYAKLEKLGFTRDVVDNHIAGIAALQTMRANKAYEAAGGTENFTRIQEWAKTALKAEEIESFNKAVEGPEADMLQAVHGLRARYEIEYGKAPSLLGGVPPANTGAGYASRAEMVAEMRDPRYEKDPAYRAKVQGKIAATTTF